MKTILQKKLFKKYPLIFQQKDLSMKETAMCWGLNIENGWYFLLEELCLSIQSYIDSNTHLKIEQVQAVQVKEKYGQLCFYYQGGDSHIRGMVHLTESISWNVCEECGSTEDVGHTKVWIYTLCKKCSLNDVRFKSWELGNEMVLNIK